jgi:hypothetical protein
MYIRFLYHPNTIVTGSDLEISVLYFLAEIPSQ